MGLTTALYSGLSGMNVNQTRIATIGNNIANVNTTAFKGSRTLFQTQFSQLISAGTAPSDTSGGVNPTQVGFGALVGATQRNMGSGSIETTGVNGDVAIDGEGFFVLNRPNGQQVYTRDGSFSLDASNRLVSQDGFAVRGYGVDANFQVVPGTLTNISVPLGTQSLAKATGTAFMDGDLSAASSIASQGAVTASQALVDGGGATAGAGTALTDLRSADAPGAVLLTPGDTITVNGIDRGGRALPSATFVVGTDGNTLGDFASWLQDKVGIQTGDGIPGNPGVTVENGQLVIHSNNGQPNAISIESSNITSALGAPFSFTPTQPATGDGIFTSYTVYDSLGTPVQVNLTMTLDSTPPTGPVWRFYAEGPDSNGNLKPLGSGTVTFDNNGNFVSATGNQIGLDRSAVGAASPLTFTMDFSGVYGLSTRSSNLIAADQDGYPPGTLDGYTISNDGTINGTFSNGLTRTLGQLAVATFPNSPGLIAEAGNNFLEGPNSGTPTITTAGQFNAGTLLPGALELSNVDLSAEFIGLITSSTGFQAASRVISTSSDLLDQLLLIAR